VLEEGGPGFCQFAITNACNARCGFCNFAIEELPRDRWRFVSREGALDAIDILYSNGIRYLVITGGEPLLHRNLEQIVERAAGLGIKVMVVTNGWLMNGQRVRRLAKSGISSFIISIDAATSQAHEKNRGLPGVCERIRNANRVIRGFGLYSTASVTMSRLLEYEALPAFLQSLGFGSVTFSYPVNYLGSNFLSFSNSDLVNYTRKELMEAFESVKRMKRRFLVVNPRPSLEEIQRFIRRGRQRFPCLAGYLYFYLDWDLDLWRCHYWDSRLCSIYDFDGSQRVRDGCTRCMIDCYRDSSVMQHLAISVHDVFQAMRSGKIGEAAGALMRRSNLGSMRALLEELTWLLRF